MHQGQIDDTLNFPNVCVEGGEGVGEVGDGYLIP